MDLPSGEWFFSIADALLLNKEKTVFHKNLQSFVSSEKFYFLEDNWKTPTNASILAIYGDLFQENLHRINFFENATKIIVHNSDEIFSPGIICKWLDESPKITLYAQNLDFYHPRAFIIPIGQANSMWEHGNKEIWKNTIIPTKDITVLQTYVSATHSSRNEIVQLSHPKITVMNKVNYKEYVNILLRSKFVICPRGNGPDTHRLWEVLGAKAIPIVKKEPFIDQLIRMYPDLPIRVMNSFSEIEFDSLVYDFPINCKYNQKDFWENLIMDIPVILTHVGKISVPEYIKDNIDNLYLWNPYTKIILLTNDKQFQYTKENFSIIDTDKLTLCQSHLDFQKQTKLDNNFRGGFWRYTTERIFYLYEWMKQYKIDSFLHLENDTLLFCNILKDLKEYIGYKSNKKLTITTMGSKNEHLFNAVTCNDITLFGKFCDYLAYEAKHHEMVSLYHFQQKYKSEVSIFPSRPEDSGNFIMDAAPFGQYVGGPDPRNLQKPEGTLTPGFVNENANFKTDKYKYEWKNENGLRRLYVNNKPLYSLHIHSKVLQEFRSDKTNFTEIIKKFFNIPEENMSYSSVDNKGNYLDVKLDKIFNKENGFFVEIGANNGLNQSNTAYFEFSKGWKGILVEPSYIGFVECCKKRPNSISVNLACVANDYKKETICGDFVGGMMSSVNGDRTKATNMVEVNVSTIDAILEKHPPPNDVIDFISIDVEGYEYNALKGMSFTKYRPRYILIEIMDNNFGDILQYMKDNEYSLHSNFSNYNHRDNPIWDGTHNDYLFYDSSI